MDFFKKISAAILLAILVGLPLSLLEALTIYSISKLYEIPYLSNFHYHQIMGLSFIIMITRNSIRFTSESYKHEDADKDANLISSILKSSSNRLFRMTFVWCVALAVHYLFIL